MKSGALEFTKTFRRAELIDPAKQALVQDRESLERRSAIPDLRDLLACEIEFLDPGERAFAFTF